MAGRCTRIKSVRDPATGSDAVLGADIRAPFRRSHRRSRRLTPVRKGFTPGLDESGTRAGRWLTRSDDSDSGTFESGIAGEATQDYTRPLPGAKGQAPGTECAGDVLPEKPREAFSAVREVDPPRRSG